MSPLEMLRPCLRMALLSVAISVSQAADPESLAAKGERVLKGCSGDSNPSACYGRSGMRAEYLAALREGGMIKSALPGPRGRDIVYQVHLFLGADDALALYEGYLTYHPEDSWALVNYANAQAATYRWTDALASLEKARLQSSDVAQSDAFIDTRLRAAFMLRRYADIRTMYQKTPRYFEDKVAPLFYVAYAVWEAGEPRAALDLAQRVARSPGVDVDVRVSSLWLAGRINEQLGDKCSAFRAYNEAKAIAANALAIRRASNAIERLSQQRPCG